MGFALRLRWEWLRRAQPDNIWARLPSKTEKIVAAMFEASVNVVLGDGASARFWLDSWLPGGPLCHSAPHLFAAVSARRRSRTVREALMDRCWVQDIVGAPTAAVLLEYFHVWDITENIVLQPLMPDRYVWKWSSAGDYTAASAYRAFFHGRTELAGARLVWRAVVPPKLKLFFWLALHGRIWTADRRKRHGLQDHGNCIFCDQADETVDHLLSACVFTREVWTLILARVGQHLLAPDADAVLKDWWLWTRGFIASELRWAFDSMVIITSWHIWKERNNRTFQAVAVLAAQLVTVITADVEELVNAGYAGLGVVHAALS